LHKNKYYGTIVTEREARMSWAICDECKQVIVDTDQKDYLCADCVSKLHKQLEKEEAHGVELLGDIEKLVLERNEIELWKTIEYNCRVQNEKLEKQLEELKMTTYCAYCGERFVLDDEAATMVTRHIYSCPQHPMREVEVVRDSITDLLIKANKQLDIAVEALENSDKRLLELRDEELVKDLSVFKSCAIRIYSDIKDALTKIEKVGKDE
jgi:hypothetical protein